MDKIIQTNLSHRKDMNIIDFQSRTLSYEWEDLEKIVRGEKENTVSYGSTMPGMILPAFDYEVIGIVIHPSKIHLTISQENLIQTILFYKI